MARQPKTPDKPAAKPPGEVAKKPALGKAPVKRRGLEKGEGGVVLLASSNPQIAKGYGEAPVAAYIAAMPGWKSEVGRRVDRLVTQTVPDVRKAVKWNSPLYGVEEGRWFLSLHCFTRYVKVAFFEGAALRPLPPGASKQAKVRYLDLHEDDPLDEAQFADWVKQASQMPGERL